jgi:hypothetical protein
LIAGLQILAGFWLAQLAWFCLALGRSLCMGALYGRRAR